MLPYPITERVVLSKVLSHDSSVFDTAHINRGWRGIKAHVHVPATPGSGSVKIRVAELDDQGNDTNIYESSAIGAQGEYDLEIYPGIIAGAGRFNDVLAQRFKVSIIHQNPPTALIYSAYYDLIP